MTDIVYLAPNTKEPFTTSDIIASVTGNSYRSVQRMVEKQKKRLETFGRVRFEITPFETKGGVQNKKIYHLNEPQATLLITFLKNTDVVADFKAELVRQFYEMRRELERINAEKVELKTVRRNLTDEIAALPESPHKQFKFAHYTNLAYMTAIGKTARQIRSERNAPKGATASDYMTADEIAAIKDAENKIGVMISLGFEYAEIKNRLFAKEISA